MRPFVVRGALAIVLGIAGGLIFAWMLVPNRAQGTPPDSLRTDFKDKFREAIAASYSASGNLERARARLQLLGDADAVRALTAQAQRALASGMPFETAQELARLASDLQAGASSLPARTPIPDAAVASPRAEPPRTSTAILPTAALSSPLSSPLSGNANQPTAIPTPSPIASPSPMPSPSVPFRLMSRDDLCDPEIRAGLLQVTVLDPERRPLPGIEISVTWDEGSDRFFTGLQPEVSSGYADYTMKGGTRYSLQVAGLGIPISGLTPPICTSAAGQPYLGALSIIFIAP